MDNTAKRIESFESAAQRPGGERVDRAEILAQVAADARADASHRPESYLRETIVPEGGE